MEWYRLKLIGLKSSKIRALMANNKRYKDIFTNLDKFINTLNLTIDDTQLIEKSKQCERYLEVMDYLERNRIGLISINDYRYPDSLKNIAKPPLFLFYKGNIELLSKNKMISIVGTRRLTKYGELCCERVVKDLVDGDVVIVSGLALGIDSVVHREVLKYKGNTIAVLGCGIDIYYPKTNIKLRDEIEKKGLLISEFPLGTIPAPNNFPIRNRIIAGLARGTVVVESSLKGGSLITASISLEEGRDVYAFPGDITYPLSQGCNKLIKLSQAKLIVSGEDILDEYNWTKINEEGIKLKIYSVLKTKMHLEEIRREVSCETSELLSNLMELEIDGYIQSLSGGHYRRRL